MTGILNALIAGVSGAVKDTYFNLVSLLLPGNGTNGAQNNTFLDSSTNNFTITPNGNTTQGTFSPFSQTGWGNYFDGTANGSLRADSTTDTNLSGDFTIQAWVYPTANGQSSNSEIISRGAAATLNGWHFGLVASTTQLYFGVNYASSGNTSTSTQSSTNISLNQWTHVAVTRSGNTCRIYINGVVDTTNTGFTGTPTVSGTEYVYVGRGSYDSTNRQFTGYINNASIIKGTALTTFSQTQPLATDTSGQALLTCTTNRFIDTNTATTAKTLTAGSGASVVAFSPFAPTAAYTTAAVGGSGYFDGTGDYLTWAGSSVGSGAFTFECWFYYTGTFAGTSAFIGPGTATTNALSIQISSSTTIQIDQYGVTATSFTVPTMTANQWYHLAVVRNSGGSCTVFLNGTRSSTGSLSITTNFANVAAIGYVSSAVARNWIGYLAGVTYNSTALYDPTLSTITIPTAPTTAVSGTQLLLNFTNAGITDATAKNDLETVGNAQISTTQSKWGGGSMSFDGTSTTGLTIPNSSLLTFGSGDWSIEFWIYRVGNSTTQGVFDQRTAAATEIRPLIYINASNQIVYYTNGVDRITASLSQNTWVYVAVVKSSGVTRMYIDGTVQATTYTDTNTYLAPTNQTRIGRLIDGFPFNGYIDDFRITLGRARTTTASPTAPFPLQ